MQMVIGLNLRRYEMELKQIYGLLGAIGIASSIAGLSLIPVSRIGTVVFSIAGVLLCMLSIVGIYKVE